MATRRAGVTDRLLSVARFGYAHWFFGNLYEAVVRVPDRLVATNDGTTPLGPGSPARYYLPVAPITVASTVAALATAEEHDRRWLAVAATCTVSAALSTAYLVRAINVPLLFHHNEFSDAEQRALLRTWYWLNGFRLAAVVGAWWSVQHAASPNRGASVRP